MKSRNTDSWIEKRNNRRQFLKLAGYGTIGLITGGFMPLFNQTEAGQNRRTISETPFVPDLDISLESRPGMVSLFPGESTQVWHYRATVMKGDKNRVIELPRSYLGPIIKVHQGEKIRIRFTNSIPEKTIIHWHGLHVPAIMDGHPRYVVEQGQSYLYEFEVNNRAGTYWYHPHPHGQTGPQVYKGLAGLFIVSDEQEQSIGLPDGEYDIPLVIQDRIFNPNNQLVYTSGHRMEQMTGFLGDMILVNGMPDFTLPVSTTAYRFRLLNGSNSRIYKLAWKDGRPLTIIGTDGGLLERPVSRQYVFLAPGERIELWSDFSSNPVGYETDLISLAFDAGEFSGTQRGRGMMMGGRMVQNQKLPNGAGFSVFNIKVTKQVIKKQTLPEILSKITPIQLEKAVNLLHPRQFYITVMHMQWSINGRVFQMEDVAEDEIVQLGTKEIWEFYNTGGGMMRMMDMPHPIHLHGKQFRVIERNGVKHDGYVDEGWKDTVLLMPGERIKILVDFDDYPGMFLYHCHNLEHEDMGMMRNYFVRV
jgi:FtsP/CotA-like multicopper oxidase with cupredoxin domain